MIFLSIPLFLLTLNLFLFLQGLVINKAIKHDDEGYEDVEEYWNNVDVIKFNNTKSAVSVSNDVEDSEDDTPDFNYDTSIDEDDDGSYLPLEDSKITTSKSYYSITKYIIPV